MQFYEFIMHIKGDIDLSLLSFSKIRRLNKQKLRITSYIKYVALYERIIKKLFHIFWSYNLLTMDFQS
jgi:hypothetical protein